MTQVLTHKEVKMRVGDTIAVHVIFDEADKKKSQIFKGVLIAVKGRESNKMFMVRKVTKENIGVERIFPLHSPFVEKIEVVSTGTTRRSKLYFTRGLSTRQLREKLS